MDSFFGPLNFCKNPINEGGPAVRSARQMLYNHPKTGQDILLGLRYYPAFAGVPRDALQGDS